MIERQIEFATHLRAMKPSLIAIILTWAPCVYFYFIERDSALILIGLGFSLLFAIPTSIIHWNYYSHDKGKHVVFNLASKAIQINKGEFRKRIEFNDIERVFLTRGIKHSRSLFYKYFYFQLDLKDNEVIYFTSLLLHENDLSFPGIISKTSYFPTIEYSGPDEQKIAKFKVKYRSKDNRQLEEIASDNRFVEEAKIAASQLLSDRIKMHNS